MKPMRPSFNVAALVLASILTTACAASGTQRSAGQFVDDQTITARVKAALVEDETTKARQIDVNVNRGVVELAGNVDTQAAKGRAAQIAQSIEGVTDVRNNLLVDSSGSRSAGTVIDDAAVTARVKAALTANDVTKARQINVETRNGVVQLHGFVDSAREANEAVREASSVPGVNEVRNDLEVKESAPARE